MTIDMKINNNHIPGKSHPNNASSFYIQYFFVK
jgi:hypothetical protein